MHVYYSENIGALKNSAQSTLSVLNKWNNKTCLLTTWPTKFFKPAVEIYSGKKKKVLSKYHCTLTIQLVTQKVDEM